MDVLIDTSFLNLPLRSRGKVRDIYDLGEQLLIVSTDRVSAFDVVMNEGIPGKGVILNTLSAYWFEKTRDIVSNHLVTTEVSALPEQFKAHAEKLEGRVMLVHKAEPLPFEFVVRGYLAGGGWKEYLETGRISGVELPEGLPLAAKLPSPIFTPSTKAEIGKHDESITMDEVERKIGKELAGEAR
ncbi:MAG: phosphoribosylaminoimidazolesuccinocarboxamide synthase, partial [Actinomycetota bacterium]|nr:phosphoribosylaminoimidazolesuccinocarboxamide synthase [Actinomycetota bacterium]